MELVEKHRVTILNAKCEVVFKVDSMLKKMSYGEDISCCTDKLWLAIKLINRLDCYCFPESTFITTETGIIAIESVDAAPQAAGTYQIFNNGVMIALVVREASTAESVLIPLLLADAGLEYTTVSLGGGVSEYRIVSNCGDNLVFNYNGTEWFVPEVDEAPVCEVSYTTCYNCIEQSDLPKMYEVLANLLK